MTEIIAYREPAALAGLAVKLPTLFVLDEKRRSASSISSWLRSQPEYAPRLLQGGLPFLQLVRGAKEWRV